MIVHRAEGVSKKWGELEISRKGMGGGRGKPRGSNMDRQYRNQRGGAGGPYNGPRNYDGDGHGFGGRGGHHGRHGRRGDFEGEGGPQWRQEEDEMVQKLRENAKSNIEQTKSKKETSHKVRLSLNQITPDNYSKKSTELNELLFKDSEDPSEVVDPEVLQVVVQTIFRKAQSEHSYSGFYASLCSDIVAMELTRKGLESKRSNVSKCEFRKMLLNYCKECFEQVFEKVPTQTEKGEELSAEAILKRKHKLMGNIEFVGELHKKGLLADSILKSVFHSLLGI